MPNKSGQDKDKMLREKLWKATEEQLSVAIEQSNISI